jgi:hypothetical protein
LSIYLLKQVAWAYRFLEDDAVDWTGPAICVGVIAGDVHDPQGRTHELGLTRKLEAGDSGHHDIGDQQIGGLVSEKAHTQ